MKITNARLMTPACLVAAALCGCATPENSRLTVGELAIDPLNPDSRSTLEPAVVPTLTSLERDDWDLPDVQVPIDPIQANPSYTTLGPIAKHAGSDNPRDHGGRPTAAMAVAYRGDHSDGIGEAVFAPVVALADFVLIIPRAVMECPLTVREDPAQLPYQRGERTEHVR